MALSSNTKSEFLSNARRKLLTLVIASYQDELDPLQLAIRSTSHFVKEQQWFPVGSTGFLRYRNDESFSELCKLSVSGVVQSDAEQGIKWTQYLLLLFADFTI